MKKPILIVLTLLSLYGQAQNTGTSDALDTRYLEDQMYMGITYNFILNKPNGVVQRNLSYGLYGGIIKDIPVNYSRTVALGVGLGYATNSYYSTMLAMDAGDVVTYSRVGNDIDLKRSKIETHLIEMPFELRWRNSSPEEYKFWRVYSGIKLGYSFTTKSKLVSNEGKTMFDNPDLKKFQYGLTLNFGYNTFNVHIYYALSSLFNNEVFMNDQEITMKPLKVGLIFYIL